MRFWDRSSTTTADAILSQVVWLLSSILFHPPSNAGRLEKGKSMAWAVSEESPTAMQASFRPTLTSALESGNSIGIRPHLSAIPLGGGTMAPLTVRCLSLTIQLQSTRTKIS
mmetsp:Transcript_13212/g.15130  ORF Transcript_13212/g.15130 Transcript_13212/m.15130 type:complete len:112 (-) Transcript_13212:1304-1639(-)